MKKAIIPILIFAGMIYYFFFREAGPVSPKTGSAVEYNDAIVKLQMRVGEKLQALNTVLRSRNPYELDLRLRELQEESTRVADALGDMDGFEGDTAFRDAALALMEWLEAACHNEFSAMVSILSDPEATVTADEEERLTDFERNMNTEGFKLQHTLNRAQEAFAKKYNLKIKPAPIMF